MSLSVGGGQAEVVVGGRHPSDVSRGLAAWGVRTLVSVDLGSPRSALRRRKKTSARCGAEARGWLGGFTTWRFLEN